jgi:hydrogenase maturation protease
VVKHFIHRSTHRSDPAFLRDERVFLEWERDGLAVMGREREQLQRDIENARREAHGLGISLAHAPESGYRAWLALIGIGNRFRRDDAAGLEVASRLRATRPPGVRILEEEGEPGTLIQDFELMKEVLIVDAISTGGRPGDLYRFDATHHPLPAETFRPSTHSLGVADAVELARELDRLPDRIAVYGIEGANFEAGEGLSPMVLATVEALVDELHAELGGEEPVEAAEVIAEPGGEGPARTSLGDVRVIRTMLEAVVRRDLDAFVACLTPDVQWDDREGWPGVRQMYNGHAGVREWWDRFMRAGGEVLGAEVEEIARRDQRVLVAVLGTFRGRSPDADTEFKARAWYVLTLRDGKVSSARLFWDRREALKAAGLLKRERGAH